MNPVAFRLQLLGGVATLDQLRRCGFSVGDVRGAVAGGWIVRIRRGWFATASANVDLTRAIRLGGSLTCISGAAARGIWRPLDRRLHVAALHGARHIKHPDSGQPMSPEQMQADAVVHWSARQSPVVSHGLLPLVDCLDQVLRCQSEEVGFAIIESALFQRQLSPRQRGELSSRVSHRLSAVVDSAGNLSESGSESLFLYRMNKLGIPIRSQVVIAGVGRVDFLIGDRQIVEIDSKAHHDSPDYRRRDLARDALASTIGCSTLRFDYSQVMFDWATVEAAVLGAIARGDHLCAGRAWDRARPRLRLVGQRQVRPS